MDLRIVGMFSAAIAVSCGPAIAQDADIDACFTDKNAPCLEAFFADIVLNNSPEKSRAIYLLGLLHEQTGDFEAAQETYMMSAGFGGGTAPNDALKALFEAHPEVFDEPSDCLQIESEACFQTIIEIDDGEDGVNAKFLLGGLLLKQATEVERGVAFLEDAATGGNQSASCVLRDAYDSGLEGLSPDYNKFVTFGRVCGLDDPLPQIDEGHFSKYENEPTNKAYAVDERGVAWYSQGFATAEIAARLAVEYCNSSPHRRSDTAECQLVNINDTWVDNAEIEEIPLTVGGVEGLISLSAQKSYRDQFTQEDGLKVFVQSRGGAWQWQSGGSSDRTIDELSEAALEKCEQSWQSRLGYPCEVVNLNGEWVK